MDISNRLQDIEDRLASLLDKAELWHLIIDECPWPVMCFDSSFKFFMVNKAFIDLTGYSSEEIVGKKIDHIIPSQHRRNIHEYMTRFVNKERKRVTDDLKPTIVARDGKHIHVDADLSHLIHQNNQYYIAYIRKIYV